MTVGEIVGWVLGVGLVLMLLGAVSGRSSSGTTRTWDVDGRDPRDQFDDYDGGGDAGDAGDAG